MREQDFWKQNKANPRALAGGEPAPEARHFADACASTYWHMDVHVSGIDGAGRDLEKRLGIAPEWWYNCGGLRRNDEKTHPIGITHIPFRSLCARDVPNLMMVGRCISVSRQALGVVRVTHTTSQMGVAVGRAAAVCHKYDCMPREAYRRHLEDLKAAWSLPPDASSLVPLEALP